MDVYLINRRHLYRMRIMKRLFAAAMVASLAFSPEALSENFIARNMNELIEYIDRSDITVIMDVDNGNKKVTEVIKGNIKKYPWIVEGEYVHVGKPLKKQILYSIITSKEGLRRVVIWQIKNGFVRISANGNVEIEKLKTLLKEAEK
jgi:hypothetical protein